MKRLWFLIYLTVAGILFVGCLFCEAKTPLKVVTTLPDYAVLAKQIGKERVSVTHIVYGDQDAHFIRPKP
ncbi:MAG: hypothetical protein KAI03_04455, partial [Candidatus Aureabacteria bacterium]|nr:hypothetical protein [Candidatus Auribacterota bacterium]